MGANWSNALIINGSEKTAAIHATPAEPIGPTTHVPNLQRFVCVCQAGDSQKIASAFIQGQHLFVLGGTQPGDLKNYGIQPVAQN